MNSTTKTAIAVCLCACGAWAGNVRHWTGGAQDGKWASSGNWDVVPVNGDVLDLSRASGALVNNLGELSVSGLYFAGGQPVSVSGGKIVFEAADTDAWTNTCKVTLDVPVQVKGVGAQKFYIYGSVDFNCPVAVEAGSEMRLVGPVQDSARSPSIVVTFNETVSGPGTAKLYLGYGRQSNTYFNKPVTIGYLCSSPLYNRDTVHFCSTGNKIAWLQPCYQIVSPECENAWQPTQIFMFGDYYTAEKGTSQYNLKTFNQRIDALHGGDNSAMVTSEGASLTLGLKTYSYGYNGWISGPTTLIVDSADGKAISFYQERAHAMSGDIVVSNGIFNASSKTSFAQVPHAYVAANGTLKSESTSTVPAFGGLETLTLEQGAHFTVVESATAPLTPGLTTLQVASGSVVSAPGKTLTFKSVFVDGVSLANGDSYTAANCSWIADDGTVVAVNAAANQWKGATGYWDESANWVVGVPDGTAKAYVTKPADSYTATIRTGGTLSSEVEIANAKVGETATVAVTAGLTVDAAPVTIGRGGVLALVDSALELKVPEETAGVHVGPGGVLSFSGTASCHVDSSFGSAARSLFNEGGEIRFSGDSVFYGGSGWYNLFGSGVTTFSGSSQLKRGPEDNRVRFNLTADAAGTEHACRIEFKDTARLSLTGDDELRLNNEPTGTGRRTELVWDSTGTLSAGGFYCGLGGETEVEVRKGLVTIAGADGVHVGGQASEYAGSSAITLCSSRIRFCEGTVWNLAGGWNANRGLYIGDGRVNVSSARHVLGVVETAAAVTNRYGIVMVGMGAGEGRYVMTGGDFYSSVSTKASTRPMVVGFANGLGLFAVSNGVFNLNAQPLYVGGASVSDIDGGAALGETYERCHNATGVVVVAAADLTKPCQVKTESLIVGKDGVGMLTVGPGGKVTANSTQLLDGGASVVRIVAKGDGAGLVECGDLAVDPGAKLEIDASEFNGERGAMVVTWKNMTGAFSPENITCRLPNSSWRMSLRSNGIRISQGGLAIILR